MKAFMIPAEAQSNPQIARSLVGGFALVATSLAVDVLS
jgi:hypothetical protein